MMESKFVGMNDEEIVREITNILETCGLIEKYTYEQIKKNNKIITTFSMKSKQGWSIENRDEWEE